MHFLCIKLLKNLCISFICRIFVLQKGVKTAIQFKVRNPPEHTEFLDELRESGATNMFGAGKWLQEEFGLEKGEARQILATWMKNFKA